MYKIYATISWAFRTEKVEVECDERFNSERVKHVVKNVDDRWRKAPFTTGGISGPRSAPLSCAVFRVVRSLKELDVLPWNLHHRRESENVHFNLDDALAILDEHPIKVLELAVDNRQGPGPPWSVRFPEAEIPVG